VVGVEQWQRDHAPGWHGRKAVGADQLDLVGVPEVDQACQAESTEDGHIGIGEPAERVRAEQQARPHPTAIGGDETAEVTSVGRLLQQPK
jgi:hypothetical protein